MPAKQKLTWREVDQRWKKMYRGRVLYYSMQPGETKAESYQRCWQLFLADRARIDAEENQNAETNQDMFSVLAENERLKQQLKTMEICSTVKIVERL